MSYNSKVVEKVMNDFNTKIINAQTKAEYKKLDLYEKLPEIAKIDMELKKTYIKIVDCIVKNDNTDNTIDIKEKIAEIRDENLELQNKRAKLLEGNKYPASYTEPEYACMLCNDTGYIDEKMCICLKKALSVESFKSSGLGEMTKTQNFENFKLDYYSKEPNQFNKVPYKQMKTIFEYCKKYAQIFPDFADKDSAVKKNLFLCGGTGLGKTHLSSSIAQSIIEKAYDVIYDTAVVIMYAFEKERFSKQNNSEEIFALTEKYFGCDLLIIDDLGTEFSGGTSVSAFFNLINMRLINDKPMIINTNLSPEILQKKYDDRIISRIFGEFTVLNFFGDDVRFKKL